MKLLDLFKRLFSYILGYFIVSFIVFEIFDNLYLMDENIYSKLAFTSYFLLLSIIFMIKSIYNFKNDKPVKLSLIYKIFSIVMSFLDVYDPDTDFNYNYYITKQIENDVTRKRIRESTNKYINCKFNIIVYTINILVIIEIIFYEMINNWILFGTIALYFLAYIYLFFSKDKKSK